MADLGPVDGEPPGAARPLEGGHPQVVLGGEAEVVAAEMGEAEVAGCVAPGGRVVPGGRMVRGRLLIRVAHLPMLLLPEAPGNL